MLSRNETEPESLTGVEPLGNVGVGVAESPHSPLRVLEPKMGCGQAYQRKLGNEDG